MEPSGWGWVAEIAAAAQPLGTSPHLGAVRWRRVREGFLRPGWAFGLWRDSDPGGPIGKDLRIALWQGEGLKPLWQLGFRP